MAKKWIVPLLLLLPFLPVLRWGLYLPEAAYASLNSVGQAQTWQGLFAGIGTGYEVLSTPLFPIGVGLLSRLGFEPAPTAALLGTLGWGIAAALMWWFGRKLNYVAGSLAAAALFCLNPWIATTLGQATGWIVALAWLIANFLIRKRYLVSALGALFLFSLFFRPSQGFSWPEGLSAPLAWSVLLFAAGTGAEWLAVYLSDNELIGLDRQRTTFLFFSLLAVATVVFQGSRLRQALTQRPSDLWAVEGEVAEWLRANSEPETMLLAGERLAYLANRQAIASSPDQLQAMLLEDPPDFVVTGDTIPWQMLREAIWFRLYYAPVARFGEEFSGEANQQLWAYQKPEAWLGPVELLNARVPDRLTILGLQMDPQPAASGQPVNLGLHLQRPRATLVDAAPFDAVLRLVSLQDNRTVSEWTVSLPRTIAAEDWQPEQVIVEPLQIRLPPDLQSAAYNLNLSLIGDGETEFWPISFNNDVNRLDRIPLGYVVVPWTGNTDHAAPVSADFAQGIQLARFESTQASPGSALDVTLFWQASDAVEQPLVVFVHLLDSAGQLVANHDGPPASGLFPTDSWLPGMTVPDTHRIDLPPELSPGTYELRAGLYDPNTGARLPLNFAGEQAVEGDSISLGSVEIK